MFLTFQFIMEPPRKKQRLAPSVMVTDPILAYFAIEMDALRGLLDLRDRAVDRLQENITDGMIEQARLQSRILALEDVNRQQGRQLNQMEGHLDNALALLEREVDRKDTADRQVFFGMVKEFDDEDGTELFDILGGTDSDLGIDIMEDMEFDDFMQE
jgi:hypothetical protein